MLTQQKSPALGAEAPATPVALLVACLSLTDLRQALAGWRQWDDGQTPFKLRGRDGTVYDCVLALCSKETFRLYHRDVAIEVTKLRQNSLKDRDIWHFTYAQTSYKAETVRVGDDVSLSLDGQNWQFTAIDFIPAEEKTSTENVLTAPMTATITAINVKNGERVREGQSLIRIEAMKMEQNLTAIKDGIIDDILVTSGQGVNEGDILLHFRESEALD